MRADNTAHLIAAASRRHELARSKAIRAVRELDAAGTTVTFESVAGAAGESLSWLYTQPDIRDEMSCGCATSAAGQPGRRMPAHHRSSDASLPRRLEAATARNRELAQDNQRLRHQLAKPSDSSAPPASAPTRASVPTIKAGRLGRRPARAAHRPAPAGASATAWRGTGGRGRQKTFTQKPQSPQIPTFAAKFHLD